MKHFATTVFVVALVGVLFAPAAFAQGGGASQTGTIAGRVTDASGAVLPGVYVSIASPAMMGTQNTMTNESGIYRFPAIPPGVYTVTYEMQGFNTLKREGIQISLGFTANVNVELAVATVQETVTVAGESPVIDTSATRVQQNFKLEQLDSLPNGRDMWALLAVTPGIAMTRIDVGGNRSGTQTGYVAYGFGAQDQQVRVLVEGINTTEGTGGAGFYFDYGSFEEVFIGPVGQGAEMPHPGVQSQFLGRSGGNRLSGGVYFDWYNNSLQGSNLPDSYTSSTAFNNNPIRKGSNEVELYRDFNIYGGGPIKKDKVWWHGAYRRQKNAVNQVNFRFDKTFDTILWNPSGKVTYQLSQNHKFIGYYQWGHKIQPNRLWNGSYVFVSPEDTQKQISGSWVWKGEWNGTITNNLYVEARYGDFGYYFPLLGYSDATFRQDQGARTTEGGDRRWQQDRDRKQATAAATYFKDGLAGSHSFKFGGELDLETQWNGFERIRAENIEHIFNNGAPFRVILGFPTADAAVGSYGARKNLLHIAKLDQVSVFASDQWNVNNKVTLNLGVRFDHYTSHIPEQRQLAFTNGPISIPATTFPAQTFFTWNSVVPRLGLAYDVLGDGKTLVKASYGYFKHNPGPGIASQANPNQAQKDITFTWNDLNGNRHYERGEEGALIGSRLAGAVSINPEITQPYTHEATLYVERQLSDEIGVRAGFVYKTNDNLWQGVQPGRPASAYTAPFDFIDAGPDGRRGTADDRTLSFLAIPSAQLAARSTATVIDNAGGRGRYKTLEASLNKRMSNRWSAGAGFGHTWSKEGNSAYGGNTVSNTVPGSSSYVNLTPNDTSLHEYTGWGFKAYGNYDAPWDIRLSPVFRHQSGQQYGRTNSVNAPAAIGFYSATILMEPLDSRRLDNIYLLDLRVEKSVRLQGTARVRLFMDLFNITNSYASEIISFATGLGFERPANVVAPRTARIGFRFEW